VSIVSHSHSHIVFLLLRRYEVRAGLIQLLYWTCTLAWLDLDVGGWGGLGRRYEVRAEPRMSRTIV
jgi:hypothetical protein